MSNKINISSVISPDILKNISTSTAIKTFGDQIKDKAKEKVISYAQGKVGELTSQLEQLVKDEIKAGIDYSNKKKQIEKNKDKYPTEEEYIIALRLNDIAYNEQKLAFEERKKQIQANINSALTDPYKKLKDEQKKLKDKLKELRKKTTKAEKDARRGRIKQVISNAIKSLAPIIALQLANQLATVISQRKKLETLVDQVNLYIDTQVTDQNTAAIATNLRNNTIALINDSIKKLQNLENITKKISLIITIFSLVLTVISLIPVPVPPKVIITLEKANKLIISLAAILVIVNNLLANEIAELNALIAKLKNINLNKLNSQELSNLTNAFLPTGGTYPPYKGFNFKIKEEQDPRFVVKGNKRRYAVAINRDGVEQLKSESSFTLDPNDLIEQLKLVIDQRNLQG